MPHLFTLGLLILVGVLLVVCVVVFSLTNEKFRDRSHRDHPEL